MKIDLKKDLRELYRPGTSDFTQVHVPVIYLSDPRRVSPEKLRTVLRQPVREVTPEA